MLGTQCRERPVAGAHAKFNGLVLAPHLAAPIRAAMAVTAAERSTVQMCSDLTALNSQ